MSKALFFFHWGEPTNYLKKALASARCFNVGLPIYLMTENASYWSSFCEVQSIATTTLTSPQLVRMEEAYQHVSSNKEFFERLCFYRWFYLDQAMKERGIDEAIMLDSDCLLTSTFSDLAQNTGPGTINVAATGFPHCTHVRQSVGPLLDYFLSVFTDNTLMRDLEKSFFKKKTFGEQAMPLVLSDMYLIWRYLQQESELTAYQYTASSSVCLDNCMSWSEGFETWGRFPMKRILWQWEGNGCVPYFRLQKSGDLKRVQALHYKGSAKRYMPGINSYPSDTSLLRFWKKSRHSYLPHNKWF
jgi:hypothetical protein